MAGRPKTSPTLDLTILCCASCGREAEIARADLYRMLLAGWPACCGEPMFFLARMHVPYSPLPADKSPRFKARVKPSRVRRIGRVPFRLPRKRR